MREQNTYKYRTEQIYCERDGRLIFGEIYVPEGVERRMPAVVYSPWYGGTYDSGAPYARALARAGYVVYTFDFCGSCSHSKSDGRTTEMSMLTEVADLDAVVSKALSLDYVDASHLFLMGASQGGLVSALEAARRSTDVRGLVLLYPALNIPDDIHQMFGSKNRIPDTHNIWGIPLGRIYFEEVWDIDVYDAINWYPGDVLILHGDSDGLVPLRYSQHAANAYTNASLKVMRGAGHGFYGSDHEQAVQHILEFLN